MAFTCCYFLLTDNFSITFLVIHNFIRHCYCKETTAITSNNVHWSTKGSFFHYLKKSAAYFFLIALFHSHNLFWEETIKSAHQRIRVVHENFLQSLILQAFVNITQFEWSRQPSQRRPGTAKFWQSQRVFHQLLRFENTVIRGSRETLWMAKARVFLWWPIPEQGWTRMLFTKLNPAHICENYPTPMEQAILIEESLVHPSFKIVKWVFQQPLGFKKTMSKGNSGRRSERSRPEYSSGDQYQIRVVQISFLQSSILHAFVSITHLQLSRQLSWKQAWDSQVLTKSNGVSINL